MSAERAFGQFEESALQAPAKSIAEVACSVRKGAIQRVPSYAPKGLSTDGAELGQRLCACTSPTIAKVRA